MNVALKKQFLNKKTKLEFIAFVSDIESVNGEPESENEEWVNYFDKLVAPHPKGMDLIFWPDEGRIIPPMGSQPKLNASAAKTARPVSRNTDGEVSWAEVCQLPEFSEGLWKEVAADPQLAGQFSRPNQSLWRLVVHRSFRRASTQAGEQRSRSITQDLCFSEARCMISAICK